MTFAEIPVSTQTFTVRSNIKNINLHMFYEKLQPVVDPTPKTQSAIIISVKYQQQKKGCDSPKELKTKRKNDDSKTAETPKRNFLNCITLVIQTEKRINIKIFKNGVFQLTGCKGINNVRQCLKLILDELKMLKNEDCFTLGEGSETFIIFIKSAMRNIDFDLGFKIKREILANHLSQFYDNDDNVIIPDAVGNKMDVKVKIRIERDELKALPVTKIINPNSDNPIEEKITFEDCLHIIEPDVKKLESKLKDKFVSISVFQNGKVLMSAMDESIQEKCYKWFTHLIKQIENDIRPKILPKKTFIFHKSQKQQSNIKCK
jgi:TATA-box binding protein (TBP) (component of TFIID and TFIIIB)